MRKILVINPGSTSTKIAIFEDMNKVGEVNLKMDENFVRTHSTVMEQAEYRTELVRDFLKEHGSAVEDFDIIAARGDLLVEPIKAACGKVLHIEIIPGERELEALADAAIAALDGTREVMEYDVIPERFGSIDEFYKFVESQK